MRTNSEPRPYFNVDDSIPHFINAVANGMNTMMDQRLSILGITWKQLAILMHCHNNAGSQSVGVLAKGLATDIASVTRLVDLIERKGYAKRVRSTTDRRIVKVALTKKGTAVITKAAIIREEGIEQIVSGLSQKDQEIFNNLLKKTLKALNA